MKKKTEEKNGDHIRQVSLSNLNQSVLLISTYKEETLDYLLNRATKVLKELKIGDKPGEGE